MTTFPMMAIKVHGYIHLNAHRIMIPVRPKTVLPGYKRRFCYLIHFKKHSYPAHVN